METTERSHELNLTMANEDYLECMVRIEEEQGAEGGVRSVDIANRLKVSKALVVLGDRDMIVEKSAANVPDVKTAQVSSINVYDILKYDTVITTKAGVEKIEEVYA